jgi:hypothetical protein
VAQDPALGRPLAWACGDTRGGAALLADWGRDMGESERGGAWVDGDRAHRLAAEIRSRAQRLLGSVNRDLSQGSSAAELPFSPLYEQAQQCATVDSKCEPPERRRRPPVEKRRRRGSPSMSNFAPAGDHSPSAAAAAAAAYHGDPVGTEGRAALAAGVQVPWPDRASSYALRAAGGASDPDAIVLPVSTGVSAVTDRWPDACSSMARAPGLAADLCPRLGRSGHRQESEDSGLGPGSESGLGGITVPSTVPGGVEEGEAGAKLRQWPASAWEAWRSPALLPPPALLPQWPRPPALRLPPPPARLLPPPPALFDTSGAPQPQVKAPRAASPPPWLWAPAAP